jgi:hypothetical protein
MWSLVRILPCRVTRRSSLHLDLSSRTTYHMLLAFRLSADYQLNIKLARGKSDSSIGYTTGTSGRHTSWLGIPVTMLLCLSRGQMRFRWPWFWGCGVVF